MGQYELTDDDLIDLHSPPAGTGDVRGWMRSGEWLDVQSSWCAAIRFRKQDGKLLVRFKSGFVAGYAVSEAVLVGMWGAPSKGKYVHAHLKKLPYTKESSSD